MAYEKAKFEVPLLDEPAKTYRERWSFDFSWPSFPAILALHA